MSTIALSVASGTDALFSLLPVEWQMWKVKFSVCIVIFLTLLNLRGVKESVLLWVPVFFLFVLTYTFAIVYGIASHAGELPGIANGVASDGQATASQLGWWDMLVVILRAYSLGAGTYTGIEAVSNGLNALREPRVETGKRTMVYMAVSLSFVVGGLLLAYLLYHVEHVNGKTLNAVLFERMTALARHASQDIRCRGAGLFGGIAVHRGANRIFRRTAHPGEHGGGPLDAHPLCIVERPARDAKRRVAHGSGGGGRVGVGGGAVHPGDGERAGCALQHQRLHHLLPVATRHGAALVAGTRDHTDLEKKTLCERFRPVADPAF